MNGALRAGWLFAAIFALLIAAPAAAAARPAWSAPPIEPQTLVRPPGISQEQAAGMVARQTGGRVLSTTPAERGGAQGYEVRVLVDGKRVKKVFVDGQGNIRGGD
jgi:hypothetical protein